MGAEARLAGLGLVLPEPRKPMAGYTMATSTGGVLYLSGHPSTGRSALLGRVPDEVSPDEAHAAAQSVALDLLATIRSVTGSLDAVERILTVTVMVNAAPGFGGHPQIADGASSLLSDLYGESGIHSRVAFGVSSLPGNATLEISMVAALLPAGQAL